MQTEKYLFGASYAPYGKCQDPPINEWEQDLDNMNSLNFTVLRVFAPWDRIERNEGEFDFSRQDRIFELARKKDLKVILNVGGVFDNYCGIYPPKWLARDYDVQWPMPTPASPKPAGVRSYVCMDDPVARAKAGRFMQKLIERYKDYDELISWMVWNEPYLKDYCYCPHTLADFKKYLHEKYNADLDKLNRTWSTEFPVEYRDWNEVEAPSGHGFLYGGASAWADWSGFCAKRLYGAVAEVTQLTKKYDPCQRPTTTNICARHTAEKVLDQQIDLAELGKSVDILGYSFYTIGFESKENQPHQKAYRLSRIRSASQETAGRFWVLETEVGPTWNIQPPYNVRAMNYWQAIGHGSKALLGWNYRSRMSDSQVSGFHLNAWDGEITERAKVNGEFSRILQRNAQLLNNAIPEKQAAVLCLEKGLQQISAAHGATNIYRKWEATPESACIEIYHRSRPGAFKLLWDMNIATDFVSEGNLDSLNKYKVLLIPTQFNVSEALADALRKYVYEGGTIIAEAPFAFRDEFNILQEKAPGLGLDEIFGGYTNDMLAGNVAPQISFNNGKASAGNIFQYLALCGGKAAARYTDGGIAAVRNTFGKGQTLLLGTDVFRQYMEQPDELMTDFLRHEITASGVKRSGKVKTEGELIEASEIEVRKMNSDNDLLLVIINHSADEFNGDISLDEPVSNIECLQTGANIDSLNNITLQANEVLACKCTIKGSLK